MSQNNRIFYRRTDRGTMARDTHHMLSDLNETIEYANGCTATTAYSIVSLTVFSVIILPIFCGNILILCSIIKFKNLQSAMYILIGNIAVADLLLGAGMVISFVFHIVYSLQEQQTICMIQYSFISMSVFASSGNIFLMSFERFSAVIFPLKHRIYSKNKVYVTTVVTIGWLFYIGIGLSFSLLVKKKLMNKKLACHQQLMAYQVYYTFSWVLMAIITIVTSFLCVVVFKTAVMRKTRRGRKTVTMLVVFCVFAVSWFPFILLTVILSFNYSRTIRCWKDWFLYLAIINSGINWIIYGVLNPKMRSAFRQIVCCNKATSHGGHNPN